MLSVSWDARRRVIQSEYPHKVDAAINCSESKDSKEAESTTGPNLDSIVSDTTPFPTSMWAVKQQNIEVTISLPLCNLDLDQRGFDLDAKLE